jgi:hypothetical protein
MLKKILIQLDCDLQPSTFDAVVATDAGVDVLLRHGGVTKENVVPLVHGAMFTRGGSDLASTAIFVGGSDVAAAEKIAATILATFFGPVRVGVMLDPNGANTTASARGHRARGAACGPLVGPQRCQRGRGLAFARSGSSRLHANHGHGARSAGRTVGNVRCHP